MALNFPDSPVNGTTYTDTNSVLWQYDGVKWDVITGTTNRLFSGAKAALTTTAALTDTATAIDWDVETFDVGDYFALTAADRFVIPATGFYRINSIIYTGAAGSGSSYGVMIKINGTTTLSESTIAANQSISYDETVELQAGDYVQVYVSEAESVGTLLTGSFLEITRQGLTPGVGVTAATAFSGVKAEISLAVSTTSTPTAIAWTSTEFDSNADAMGSTYWTVATAGRLTVRQTGYFRVKVMIATGSAGTDNSYTVALKKNTSTTVATVTLGPNDMATIDETYTLAANDYLEIFVSNSGSVGTILNTATFEITRLGI